MASEIIVGKKYKVSDRDRKFFTKDIIKILSIGEDEYVLSDGRPFGFHINSLFALRLTPVKKQKID